LFSNKVETGAGEFGPFVRKRLFSAMPARPTKISSRWFCRENSPLFGNSRVNMRGSSRRDAQVVRWACGYWFRFGTGKHRQIGGRHGTNEALRPVQPERSCELNPIKLGKFVAMGHITGIGRHHFA
jgi:hypothetical protein